MVQSPARPKQPIDRWAEVGIFACFVVLVFVPSERIRSTEAVALEAALRETNWVFFIGLLGCGLAWVVLWFRKPPRRAALDGPLERISKPPEAGPVGASRYWLWATFNAIVWSGFLAMKAPETLETVIAVGGAMALIAGAAWLGLLAFGGLTIMLSARRAMLRD